MPIDAPNLDDLSYREIVERAKQLIPIYCPEWTNFNDADPGMTLVQLFAWMTEMSVYRLNRVPDATYVHFLNFIGERQRSALPARTLVSFEKLNDKSPPTRIPKLTEVATEQTEDVDEVRFVTARDLVVLAPRLERIVGLSIGQGDSMAVERVMPELQEGPPVYEFGDKAGEAAGLPILEPDPDRDNLEANVYEQFLYIGHNLLDRLHTDQQITVHLELKGNEQGKLFDLQRFFCWEFRTAEGWLPFPNNRELEAAGLPPQLPIAEWPDAERELVSDQGRNLSRYWLRGHLDFETYYLELVQEHPKGRYKPRRGDTQQLELLVTRAGQHTLEFRFTEPVRPGHREALIIRFPRLSLRVNATYSAGLHWFYFTEDGRWSRLPDRNVTMKGLDVWLEGPFPADAASPARFQAQRVRAVDIAALTDEGELVISLERQIQLNLWKGPNINRLEETSLESVPIEPWSQSEYSVKPQENGALYIGSDVFEDTVERVDFEIGYFFKNWKYERTGEWGLTDNLKDYRFRLEFRDKNKWRSVKLEDDNGHQFEEFCWADMTPTWSQEDQFFTVRMSLSPARHWKGIAPVAINGQETYWIRLVLSFTHLSQQVEVNVGQTQTGKATKDGEQKTQETSNIFIKQDVHFYPQIWAIRVQHRGGAKRRARPEGEDWYRHVLHDFECIRVNDNREHPRFSSARSLVSRSLLPKDTTFPWIAPVDTRKPGRWVYLQFDRPLPRGEEISIYFRMTAENVAGADRDAAWEYMDIDRWKPITNPRTAFDFRGSGFLRIELPVLGGEFVRGDIRWLRCRVPDTMRKSDGTRAPIRYPRLTHVLLNAAEVANLQRHDLEKFSAFGVPNQAISLVRRPVVALRKLSSPHGRDVVVPEDVAKAIPEDLHDEAWIEVQVDEGDGGAAWEFHIDDDLRDADRHTKAYSLDPVRGIVRFGDGVHGTIPKAGTHNIVVSHYYSTDGRRSNVPSGAIRVCPAFGSQVTVWNPFPGTGGRDTETVEEIVKRAPRALTGRSRAVTHEDFEQIAREASGMLARCHAWKDPNDDPWVVRLTVLPNRDERTQEIPDAEEIGLLRITEAYVAERTLINTQVRVSMAELVPISVEMRCLLNPGTNPSGIRERAEEWIRRFLDPYSGGLDGRGWPFGEVPRPQDLQHILKAVPEIRHVHECTVQRHLSPGAAHGESRGLPRRGHPGQLFVLATNPSVLLESD